jgi:Fe-S-cluster containining protein
MGKKGGDRCSGHCCKCVTIRMSPEDLRVAAEDAKKKGLKTEELQLYEILIPLGDFPSNPLMKLWGESWSEKALKMGTTAEHRVRAKKNTGYQQHFYTCRHIQMNGDCGIYETRPQMCRTYPNGKLCDFEECTLSVEGQIKTEAPYFSISNQNLVNQIKERGLIPPKSLLKKIKESEKRAVGILAGELFADNPSSLMVEKALHVRKA